MATYLNSSFLLANWFIYGMLTSAILMIGIYLLFSKVPVHALPGFTPATRVRKMGGMVILVRGLEYLFVFFYLPQYGSFIETGELWEGMPYLFACMEQFEEILLIPALTIFMYTLFQGLAPVRVYHILWSVIFPVVLLIYTVIHGLIEGGYGWDISLVTLPIARFYWLTYICVMLYVFIKHDWIFKRELEQHYSSVEYREFHWLGYLALLLVAYFVVVAFTYMRSDYKPWMLIVERVFSLVIAVYIAWHADRQEQITWDEDEKSRFERLEPETTSPDEKDENEALKPIFDDIEVKLNRLMVEEKLFTDPDLSREAVVRALGTNRTYFSKYMTAKEVNFHTYINRFRIDYAVSLMENQSSSFSLGEIATACGFRSQETFLRAFKRVKDCLPSQYGGG